MKILKTIAISAILSVTLMATPTVFDKKNNFKNEMGVLQLIDKIDANYRYKTLFKLDDKNVEINDTINKLDDYDTIGEVYHHIADKYDAKVRLDELARKIYIETITYEDIKLPNSFNARVIKKELNKQYPETIIRQSGQTITVYGTKSELKEIKSVFDRLNYTLNRTLNLHFAIIPYDGVVDNDRFVGAVNIDPMNSFMEKSIDTEMKHNQTFVMSFNGQQITIQLDLINNRLIFDNKNTMTLDTEDTLGYVFEANDESYILVINEL